MAQCFRKLVIENLPIINKNKAPNKGGENYTRWKDQDFKQAGLLGEWEQIKYQNFPQLQEAYQIRREENH